ncbi:hypothetical protein Pogu_1859 [Pyrobaculum oguniense TE7]|uniref:Uncharacterized protein n=1 Tax=Pyrobaculum oguniense (strain DSM 13380 / JCM 10595 / TE7) TaxID=698757 RepID=H6QAW3_PYROT|nr:hypothetical protein Pogu_1859 [Pyrobaculum oguniense TE7]
MLVAYLAVLKMSTLPYEQCLAPLGGLINVGALSFTKDIRLVPSSMVQV